MPRRMSESTPSPEAGKRLREERRRARLSTRAVQRLSEQIALEKETTKNIIFPTAGLQTSKMEVYSEHLQALQFEPDLQMQLT